MEWFQVRLLTTQIPLFALGTTCRISGKMLLCATGPAAAAAAVVVAADADGIVDAGCIQRTTVNQGIPQDRLLQRRM